MSEARCIRLQKRDREIIDLLRSQGFATFDQLKRYFFLGSTNACSKRLVILIEGGYLHVRTASDFFKGSTRTITPILMGLSLHPNTRIYTLSSMFRKQVSETNRLLKYHLCIHQLLLNDVRFELKAHTAEANLVLNDPQLKTWGLIEAGRPKEFTPDLSYEFGQISLAVELERSLKSLNRYSERFGFYQGSVYSHVLYVYVNEGHLSTLLQYAGLSRRFAFAHYLKLAEVFSNTWGYMRLTDWVAKVKSVSR